MASSTPTTTVVIVDSNPHDYASLFAEFREFEFRTVQNGEEAMRQGRLAQEQLWLVNVRLPDCCGFELASTIRQRKPSMPVYIVGDMYRQEDERAAAQAGVSGYVCKPPGLTWLSCLRPDVRAGPPSGVPATASFSEPAGYESPETVRMAIRDRRET